MPIARKSSSVKGPGRGSLTTLMVLAASFTGCASLEKHLGDALPLDEVEAIQPDTHYSDVLQRFGPPNAMSALPEGMAFQYEYIRLVERQWGLTLPGNIGKWIKAVYANADADVELMTFIFDDAGRLRAADAEHWTADAGAGLSLTLIFSVGSLTDTARYEQISSGALDWGAALTHPVLQTLNAHSNLEVGANGVQITATAAGAGQHTLELD